MAYFAEIGLNNVVQQVIVVHNNELLDENGVEQESKGQQFCRNLLGGTWVQTSYNGSFRKNFAGSGYTYDTERDAFIPPKPFNSWTLDKETCQWKPPTPVPDNENMYSWDETTTSWQLVDNS
jgi:hypothetical protein